MERFQTDVTPGLQRRTGRILRLRPELSFDSQQLLYFRGAVERASEPVLIWPQLWRPRDRRWSESSVSRTVRHYRRYSRRCAISTAASVSVSRADLVDLDQNGIAEAALDAVRQTVTWCEQIVADQLALVAEQVGRLLPAVEFVFAMPSSIDNDRIARHEFGEVLRLLRDRNGSALPS